MANRRKFLKTASTAAVGAAVLPTILPSCVNWKGANDRLVTAHIGVGSRGTHEMQSYFLPYDDFRVAAVCDVFKSRRNNASKIVNDYYSKQGIESPDCLAVNDYRELLDRKDIDVFAITTCDHWHLPIALEAARAGKHIHVNKPLGLSVAYMQAMQKALAANNLCFNYGTQQRSYDFMKLAVDYIQQGALGEVQKVLVWAPGGNAQERHVGYFKEQPVQAGFDYDRWLGPAPVAPYTDDRVHRDGSFFINDYSIGFLGGWGAHPLDIMVWALKDKLSSNYKVKAKGAIDWPEESMYNNINKWDASLQYDSGLLLRFISQDIAKPIVMEYASDYRQNGTLFVGDKGWITLSRTYAECSIPEINQAINDFPKQSYGLDGERFMHGVEFAKLIRGEQKVYMDAEDAILADLISHTTDAAIRLNQEIDWDAQNFSVKNSEAANALLNRKHRPPYAVL